MKEKMKMVVPTKVYSRVVGYYSEVWGHWNKGKQQEFKERRAYDVKEYREQPKEAESNQTIPA